MREHRVGLHSGLRRLGVAVAIVLAGSAQLFAGAGRLSKDLREGLDAGRGSFDVIVQADRASIDSAVARYGVRVKRTLKTGAVIEASREALEAMSADGALGHLAGDTLVRSMMAVTNDAIGADQAWAGALGVAAATGRGVGVAVIDSGIASHAALRGRVVAAVDFTDPNGRGQDLWGHGTHVSGIIAGASDTFKGVAPGAHLVSLKVLDETGAGRASSVIAAIDWVIANKSRYGLRIINLSLGRPVFDSYVDDPVCQAVERAFRAGLVVIASAGNYGQLADGRRVAGGIVSPGNSPYALTIGAVDTKGTVYRSDDEVAVWSSRGPTQIDGLLKPDLAAPGRNIVSLAVPGSTLGREHPDRQTGTGQTALFRLSGTSMATAVASGAAALVLEANRTLSPAQVRVALQLSSSFIPEDGVVGAGAGNVNIAGAVQLAHYGPTLDGISTAIGGETAELSGIVFGLRESIVAGDSIVWGVHGDSIVWGIRGDYVVWGNSIVWGVRGDSIVWGVRGDYVVWGNSIVWGLRGDSIVWGVKGDYVVWGNSIVWGVRGDSIVWG